MTRRHSIIIGIPAFNEQANLLQLLNDLATQKLGTSDILKVIVNSDGSTDETAVIAKRETRLPMMVIKNHERKGIAIRLNEILDQAAKFEADAIILLDADIRINDPHCLAKLVRPILQAGADLTSCRMSEAPSETLIERALAVSMQMKNDIFENYRHGDNVYTCHGPVRGLSAKLANQLRFKESVGNDAYSYLFVKANNFSYTYIKDTSIIYKLPMAWNDHANQSQRFLHSQRLLSATFGAETIKANYQVPTWPKLKTLVTFGLRQPLLVGTYFYILLAMRLKYHREGEATELWNQVTSSKQIA